MEFDVLSFPLVTLLQKMDSRLTELGHDEWTVAGNDAKPANHHSWTGGSLASTQRSLAHSLEKRKKKMMFDNAVS